MMAHSSTPSTSLLGAQGQDGWSPSLERQQIGWGPGRKGTGAHFRLLEVPDTQEKTWPGLASGLADLFVS